MKTWTAPFYVLSMSARRVVRSPDFSASLRAGGSSRASRRDLRVLRVPMVH